jgi:tetratricopeptide (TPR) repeat protein
MKRLYAHLTLYSVAGALWLGAARLPRPAEKPALPAFDYGETERHVALLEEKEAVDPGALGLGMLAQSYLSRFAETGDETDLSRAESAARRSLTIRERGNRAAKTALGRSLVGQHRFNEAEQSVRGVAGGEAVLAECLIETGRYDEALKVLSDAQATYPTDPNLKALRARLFEIDGEGERALSSYRDALAEAQTIHGLSAPSRAWFHARLGNALERMGKSTEAEAEYTQALEHFPGDWRTLTSLARLTLDRGDLAGAKESASASLTIVETPEAAMVAADAAERLGENTEAARLRARIAKSATGAHKHGRSLALYFADRGERLSEAVALARDEVRVRPSIESYDALAWCLYKAGRKREAETAMRKALVRGTCDPQLLSHAKTIFMENRP